MRRLFFALLPDEQTLAQCQTLQNRLSLDNARPVIRTNLHITVLFLGLMPETQICLLRQALADIALSQITLTLGQTVYWKKARVVVWTADLPDALLKLRMQLLEQVGQLLTMPEPVFHPHITLLRKVRARPAALPSQPLICRPPTLALLHSESQPDGVRYRPLLTRTLP